MSWSIRNGQKKSRDSKVMDVYFFGQNVKIYEESMLRMSRSVNKINIFTTMRSDKYRNQSHQIEIS